VEAFGELCTTYYCLDTRHQENEAIIKAYLIGAENDLEEHIRMGYIAALGVLPSFMIRPHLPAIMDSLVKHSLTPLQAVLVGEMGDRENIQTYRWSEARTESVRALTKVVKTVGYGGGSCKFSTTIRLYRSTTILFQIHLQSLQTLRRFSNVC